MRTGRITIVSIVFTGLLTAQTLSQVPVDPSARFREAHAEKNTPATKLTATVPIFRDIAAEAGLTASHISSADKRYVIESMSGGIGLFDCDNDGKLDIVMVNGSIVDRFRQGGGDLLVTLWHQDSDLKFTDITQKAGLARKGWGMGVAVADFDNDGNLDLFVTGYGGNALYRNKGNCTFEDVTDTAGVRGSAFSTGAAWADYDRDGTFTDNAMVGGIAMNSEGQALGSMGVTWGDYDHSGRLSMFITEFADQPNTLYRNEGSRGFEDLAMQSRLGQVSLPLVGWGTSFFDMDNDGWLDLFVVNGHVYPQMDNVRGSAAYVEPMLLHRNLRNGIFEEVSKAAGLADIPLKSRRGAAFGDIANNGNVDVVVLNVGESPSLLLNTNQSSNHRVLFRLIGTKSNRAAIGTRVTIHSGTMTQFDEVLSCVS